MFRDTAQSEESVIATINFVENNSVASGQAEFRVMYTVRRRIVKRVQMSYCGQSRGNALENQSREPKVDGEGGVELTQGLARGLQQEWRPKFERYHTSSLISVEGVSPGGNAYGELALQSVRKDDLD
jgi:hypothetical protein